MNNILKRMVKIILIFLMLVLTINIYDRLNGKESKIYKESLAHATWCHDIKNDEEQINNLRSLLAYDLNKRSSVCAECSFVLLNFKGCSGIVFIKYKNKKEYNYYQYTYKRKWELIKKIEY